MMTDVKEGKEALNLSIDQKVKEAIKLYGVRHKEDVSAIVEDLLRNFLKAASPEPGSESAPARVAEQPESPKPALPTKKTEGHSKKGRIGFHNALRAAAVMHA